MIKLVDIKKSFKLGKTGSIEILKGINLEIQKGEFLSIMGASGSGKSTLMNLIGLLDKPTSGEYYLDGNRVDNLSDSKTTKIRGRKIGFIFQNYSLLARMNTINQITTPLEYQGYSYGEAKKIGMKYLEMVGLADKYKSLPNELSGGQSQRVAIARALATNAELILADEPTGALDSITGKEILELFKTINNQGKTILLITHDSSIAAQTKRIIQIKDGMIC